MSLLTEEAGGKQGAQLLIRGEHVNGIGIDGKGSGKSWDETRESDNGVLFPSRPNHFLSSIAYTSHATAGELNLQIYMGPRKHLFAPMSRASNPAT